ncbi:GAL4-transcription factor [Apiospora saccharicola]|uniref:GAL4-transcription factor n=1 Tax=Apiospora saccharicola TaxID=335842 RepID=A0ABR1W512_9PEZI
MDAAATPPPLSPLACDTCRAKKLKCSRERPTCGACLQTRRACHYSGRILRSPLTRVYLTSVERRLNKLEALVAQRLPDLNIDEALASFGTGAASPSASAQSPSVGQTPFAPTHTSGPDDGAAKISEAVPDEADGFDWQEDANEVADGMAALSVEPKGAGYLGSTAGVFFLRSLLFWMGNPALLLPESPGLSDPGLASSRLSQSLASTQVMTRLMESYFSVYHLSYPFIHEATFRAQYHEIIPRPSQRSWQMLQCTVLALGAWCLDHDQDGLHDDLYHQALSFGEDESLFESANLTLVQALVLLSNLSQKRNKPNTGSNFLGLAIRMALSLGLHRELPNWKITLLQREMRRRVWWGLYLMDSGASTTFGRPILLPGRESMDAKPVLNISDDMLIPRTTTLPDESEMPTIYSGLKAQSDFHMHSNHISNRLLLSTGVSVEEALIHNNTLDTWSKTLPPYFQPDRDVPCREEWYLFAKPRLWWRLWNLKIILFRQIVLKRAIERHQGPASTYAPNNQDNLCRDIGVDAAHSTVVSIHQYLNNCIHTRLVSWYSVYFIFHASLVIALAILGDKESPELPKWQSDIDLVRDVLRRLLADNPLANRCADILDHLLPLEPDSMMNMPFETMNQFDPTTMDFSLWTAESADLLNSFNWPEPDPNL